MSRSRPVPLPRIRGSQIGLKKPWLVDQIKADMRGGLYQFQEIRGRIGGVRDRRGRYHVLERHHRMIAALEIYFETGDAGPVQDLIRWGLWNYQEHGPLFNRPLPFRNWWGAFRNWLGV